MVRLAGGAICGIAAGIVAGIGARGAMRMVADGVPDPIRSLPSFTVEGTTGILVVAALEGAPFGALFALAHDTLPGPNRARGGPAEARAFPIGRPRESGLQLTPLRGPSFGPAL